MTAANPIPAGYSGAIPYLTVHSGAEAIDFYCKAFGAVETMRMTSPDGRIGHAEIKIRESVIMLSDEHPELGIISPKTLGGTPGALMFYFPDVDAVAAQAVAAGAKIVKPIENQFYGDRAGKLQDPFGHMWWIATRFEDISPEEMQRRAAELYGA